MREEQALQPSRLDPCRFNLRNKGLRSAGGKLYKGCVKDAFSKLSIGSIPSNYESIIYKCDEKKGFGTSQKRFYTAAEAAKSEYDDLDQESSPPKKIQASHSNKGFGTLISKEKRQWRRYVYSPGPGKYFEEKNNLENQPIQKKKKRHYNNLQRQDNKRKQLQLNKENEVNPGPGYYEVNDKNQHSLAGWKSSFATKQTRDGYISKSKTPGPGCYNSDHSPKKEEKHQEKRQFQAEELYNKLSQDKQPTGKHYLPKKKNPQQPGPGHYDHDTPNFKPLYQRIKISHNFIQSPKNRFNDPVEPKDDDKEKSLKGPTPCTYEIPSVFAKEKRLIDMSSFMSESRRVVFEGGGTCNKMFYDAVKDKESNFHFNITGKWL